MRLAFLVREAGEADRAALLAHTAALNAFEAPFSGDRNLGPDGAAESLRDILRRVAESGGRSWVAEAEGEVVGHLCLALETMPGFVAAGQRSIAYVTDAFVREAWRGQGAFRAMLAEAERFAAARGARRLLIGVLAGNDRAERIYRLAGFRPYAVEMVKDLPPPPP